jgi:hypothetical protein
LLSHFILGENMKTYLIDHATHLGTYKTAAFTLIVCSAMLAVAPVTALAKSPEQKTPSGESSATAQSQFKCQLIGMGSTNSAPNCVPCGPQGPKKKTPLSAKEKKTAYGSNNYEWVENGQKGKVIKTNPSLSREALFVGTKEFDTCEKADEWLKNGDGGPGFRSSFKTILRIELSK